jgi:WD40 repeat protein
MVLVFGATNACAMNWFSSWFKKSANNPKEIVAKELAMLDPSNPANDRSKNFRLLYDLLLTLPPELIDIILDYKMDHTYTNKRQLEKTIDENHWSTLMPAETPDHTIVSYFHLPDQGYYLDNIDLQTDAHQIKYLGQKNFREFLGSTQIKAQFPCNLNMLLPTNVDHEIKAWDSKTNEQGFVEVKNEGSLVQFSGNRLVWGSSAGKLILMDPQARHPVTLLANPNHHTMVLHLAKLSKNIFVAVVGIASIENNSCSLQFWNLKTGKSFLNMDINYVADYCTKLSKHSFALATGEYNNVIEIWYWNLHSAQPIKTFTLPYKITALTALHGNLLLGSQGGMLSLMNPLTGEHKGAFIDPLLGKKNPRAHQYPIESLFKLANGRVVSKAGFTTKIWN